MSIDDQFYKNEDGVIGWIDQKIMLFARDMALCLRWLTGKEAEKSIKLLWYFSILTAVLGLIKYPDFIVFCFFGCIFAISDLREWPLFGVPIKCTTQGTRISLIKKFSYALIFIITSVLILYLTKSVLITAAWITPIFGHFYYSRVNLPPPKRESIPAKIKKLLEKLKPAPKPIPNPTS